MRLNFSKTLILAALLSAAPNMAFAADDPIPGSELVEIADVSIGLNGLVCDFCSLALNKTFGKSDAVSGSFVDLDAKTMSVVFHDGQDIDDERLIEMVKDAGYTVTQIKRKDGTVFTPPAKAGKG